MKIEMLLEIHNGDFDLWKEEKHGLDFYYLGIEGYIGYEKIQDFIVLYSYFLDELHKYLIENNYPKTEKEVWKTVYSSRAIEICYENDYYWVFLDTYESTEIWDTYYYLEDVIEQLKEVELYF